MRWDGVNRTKRNEPLTLDALSFGILVHETLQTAVSTLEANGGFGKAKVDAVNKVVEDAVVAVASRWEAQQAVPAPIIWRNALDSTRKVSTAALTYHPDPLPNQKSWTEVPFGMPDVRGVTIFPGIHRTRLKSQIQGSSFRARSTAWIFQVTIAMHELSTTRPAALTRIWPTS